MLGKGFDYCFLGSEGEERTVPVLVAIDRNTLMLFGHVVPRKGLAHEHGARELARDLTNLEYHEVILKCDGEPALKRV